MKEILDENGFSFVEYCKVCNNRYMLYRNPAKLGVEVKVHVNGNYFKLYQPDGRGKVRQTAFGGVDKLKQVIGTV